MSVPVTEQFLTAERTLAIEGKSIASMGVSGGNLVLTRENTSALSVALPSGGGGAAPLGQIRIWNPTATVEPGWAAGTKALHMSNWQHDGNIEGADFPISSGVGQYGFGFPEAGWYQHQFRLWVGFTAVTTPLPSYFLLRWEPYGFAGCAWEFPVLPTAVSSLQGGNRALPGYVGTVETVPFYDPGDAVTGGADASNWVVAAWEGDALMKSGSGSPAQYAFRLITTRLA